jgi:hypothetical protein
MADAGQISEFQVAAAKLIGSLEAQLNGLAKLPRRETAQTVNELREVLEQIRGLIG